jgi:hypothetical protein
MVWLQRRTGNKVIAVQCDGGGEFLGEKENGLLFYCLSKGIEIRTTSRSTPAENGVTESYCKSTHNAAQTIGFHGKTSLKFWPERETHVAMVDTYMVKPKKVITAYEMIHGVRPSFELIKVSGCHGFAFVPKDARENKQITKMRPGIYMGVAGHMNGYKMYDPVAMTFFEGSTAVFDEYSFGFTQLIERVSGPPMLCPKEWIEALNKEWEEKHEIENSKDIFEDGYMKEEEGVMVMPSIIMIDPNSPVLEHRIPEISVGDEIELEFGIPERDAGCHNQNIEQEELPEVPSIAELFQSPVMEQLRTPQSDPVECPSTPPLILPQPAVKPATPMRPHAPEFEPQHDDQIPDVSPQTVTEPNTPK